MALDVFVRRLCAGIGAMLASLAGVNVLVFTGGFGENAAPVRERASRQFEFLGLGGRPGVECARSRARYCRRGFRRARVGDRTEEDWEIARETRALFARSVLNIERGDHSMPEHQRQRFAANPPER